MSKVIGIVGARRRNSLTDFQDTWAAFKSIFEEGDTIVSGGCPLGGDKFAEVIALLLSNPERTDLKRLLDDDPHYRREQLKGIFTTDLIKIHWPDWHGQGRSAGFNRNTYIARDAQVLIAVVAPDRKGGTEDTIRKFGSKGPLILV